MRGVPREIPRQVTTVADPAIVVRSRVWDLPIRLVHWLIVALIAFSWWSAEQGDLERHRLSGYAILGLLVFRFYWGLFGSSTARFAHFVRGPRTIGRYLKGEHRDEGGHSPLGALSVVALFAVIGLQVALGLFAIDVDGLESGPLASRVSFDAGRWAAEWHATLFNALLGLIGLHVIAILFYILVKRRALIRPMLTGSRTYPADDAPSPRMQPLWLAAPGIAIAGAAVWIVTR